MKKSLLIGIAVFVVVGILSFGFFKGSGGNIYSIDTPYGVIKVKLFDETPMHRDNFIKMVKENKYDGAIFHRVVKDFVIQGGEVPGTMEQQEEAKIPAEITPNVYAKRGVLAAARQGDDVNPKKASSSMQFFIVTGKVYTAPELQNLEMQLDLYAKESARKARFMEVFEMPQNAALKAKLIEFSNKQMQDSAIAIQNILLQQVDASLPPVKAKKFSPEQVKLYTTVGGTPHLDGEYTIFGEVIEGMDVVDKIASQQVGEQDRPLQEIPMTIK
ncbi:MAG: peptidylprolyl isomerase [Bacteroidetes bacterium]|nr:peptidylprolyl isomerase [Bacteroidota bacterium]